MHIPTKNALLLHLCSLVAALAVSGTAVAAGTVYYIDSTLGNDSYNGLSPSVQGSTIGPWRSLSKLAARPLLPGDSVKLACGSTWNETLRLSASGTIASPITISAANSNCVSRPAIDGGSNIPSAAWTQYKGNIYKASLDAAPLQVMSASGYMTQAHHPNIGHDASNPKSIYLSAAATSDVINSSGRLSSSYIVSGSDLKIPAGAAINPGTTIRIRSASFIIDESLVSSVIGTKISLSTLTSKPITAGWGYYFLGQLWMLDSPGEWHYDSSTRTLYIWMPDSLAPSSNVRVSKLPVGIDLQLRSYVTLDGLAVRGTGIGIDARRSTGITVRNSSVNDSAGVGFDASASRLATVAYSSFRRTGGDAVSGVDRNVGWATDMQVIGNTISDSGVAMNGETILSLPVRTFGAIRPGHKSIVKENTISNAGYNGIWPNAGSSITDNFISGACTVLDDCGAIYTDGALANTIITGNIVQRSRGSIIGKPLPAAYTQAQGIYIDESASGVNVTGNTVVDTDNGIQIHVSSNNIIKDNKLYGNRMSQLWMQETRKLDNTNGDVFGNSITGNQFVVTKANSRGIFLDTIYSDTVHFGSFKENRFFDKLIPTVAEERIGPLRTAYSLSQWKGATAANGTSRGNDALGWGASETNFAAILVSGSNIVPNGTMLTDSRGWSTWNATFPKGSASRESCLVGWCLRYVAGASAGIVSSPNFSITANTWYRLTVDVGTSTAGQMVDLVVRRGGGGSNGYEILSDRTTRFNDTGPNGTVTRYSMIFKALKSVRAADPVTGDLGARVDIQNIQPGQTLRIANLELMPIAPTDANNRSDILANTGSVPIQAGCPVAATQPALCNSYVRLTDNAAVVWPMYLPARSSEIVFTRDSALIDADRDGIPDAQDACANTVMGKAVNSRGCAIGQ